jgi:hypothetical protein
VTGVHIVAKPLTIDQHTKGRDRLGIEPARPPTIMPILDLVLQ